LQGVPTGSVLLATFTQGESTQAAGGYSATVDWGDGNSDSSTEANSPVTIVVSGQTISVYGSHTYTTAGNDNLSVTLSTAGYSATAKPTATVTPDISNQMSHTASGLGYNRRTKLFGGSITLTNNGTTPLSGELKIVFTGLPAGVVLANASGYTANGDPYILIDLATPLAPGQSISFSVFFSNPNFVLFSYSLKMFDDTTTC
jgi:hypothetical protein